MRRVKQAAMLLTMAIAIGFSGPSADARASRIVESDAVTVAEIAMPTTMVALETGDTRLADGEWRYIPSRR